MKAKGDRAPGRPSSYTEDKAALICGRIAAGESLVSICRDEDMPDVVTVYRWIAANESFRNMYARARDDQADTLADQILDIADTEEDPAKGRLRVDARKWVAAKLKPRKYGERIAHEGTEDGPPIRASIAVKFIE